MTGPDPFPSDDPPPGRGLRAYLLGAVGFDAFLALQRRLVYDVGGEPDRPAVVVCEHPPGVTIGRDGSRMHLRVGGDELAAREWPVRWMARGGGVLLHLPGQAAVYPIVPLAGRTPAAFARTLSETAAGVARAFDVPAATRPDRPGVWANGRLVGHVGLAVRGGVTAFGLTLNVNPDLERFRGVWVDGDPRPMTSLVRESTVRVRLPAVRQMMVERLADALGCDRVSVFHHHPAVPAADPTHADPAARLRS